MEHTSSRVICLCIEGTRAEFEKRLDDARALYWQAWEAARDDYEACVAAHYVARFQDNSEEKLRWNQLALNHANAIQDDSVKAFYPSLYLNMGQSYELLGDQVEAQRYYDLAESFGVLHEK